MTEWEDLIAGITFDDSASASSSSSGPDGDTSGTGIVGAKYLNEELGFQLEWDGRVWEADQVSNSEDGEGVELTSDASYAYIVGTTGTAVESSQECVDALVANVESGESFENVRAASSRTERPDSPRDAAAELLTFTDTTDGSKTIAYLECRPLDGSAVLAIQFAARFENYETELPVWQELLDSIEIGQASADANDEQSDERPTSTGKSVTTPNFGVTVSYDDSVWTPKDYSDEETDQIEFEAEFGYAQVIAVAGEPDLTRCIQTMVENEQQFATDEIVTAPRPTPRPETVRGAEAELYTYTYEGESGPNDVLVYMECREMASGEGVIAVTFTTFPDAYEEALPAVEALLEGIEG
jgi:hypothetical protein